MSSSGIPRPRWRTLLAAMALALLPAFAQAQTGTLRGTVAGSSGEALSGARVTVTGTRAGAITDALGAFTVRTLGAGTHQVRVSHVGYRDLLQEVSIRAGEETLVAFQLEDKPFELDAMVVSASRTSERVTEAPATVTRIGTEQLDATIGNTFAGALKEVKGLDFVQVGMTSVGVNARGFNSSFNNRMLMVEDGRVMVLPENGLPVGQFTATPKVDLAGIEVLVGPGAALYGADASSGVISLETKDPRTYPGLTVELTGGNRSYGDIQARYAGVVGEDWGYKVSGEYQQANDWSNRLTLVSGRLPAGPVQHHAQPGREQPVLLQRPVHQRRHGPAVREPHGGGALLRVRREASGDDQHAADRHHGLPGREVPDPLTG